MIGRRPCRRRFDPVKAQLGNIQCIDEGVDHANRIALINPVIEAFRQQRHQETKPRMASLLERAVALRKLTRTPHLSHYPENEPRHLQ